MLELRILLFILFAIGILFVLFKHVGKWSKQFREYMTAESNKVFKNNGGWDKPFGLFLSKVLITFFGLMFIVFVYIVFFSIGT